MHPIDLLATEFFETVLVRLAAASPRSRAMLDAPADRSSYWIESAGAPVLPQPCPDDPARALCARWRADGDPTLIAMIEPLLALSDECRRQADQLDGSVSDYRYVLF